MKQKHGRENPRCNLTTHNNTHTESHTWTNTYNTYTHNETTFINFSNYSVTTIRTDKKTTKIQSITELFFRKSRITHINLFNFMNC